MTSESELFAKLDALLNRHRAGSSQTAPPAPSSPPAAAEQVLIPTLTDIARESSREDAAIPVLTEMIGQPPEANAPLAADEADQEIIITAPADVTDAAKEALHPALLEHPGETALSEALAREGEVGHPWLIEPCHLEPEIAAEEVPPAAPSPVPEPVTEPVLQPAGDIALITMAGDDLPYADVLRDRVPPGESPAAGLPENIRAAIEAALVSQISAQLTKSLQEAVAQLMPQIEDQVREAVAQELERHRAVPHASSADRDHHTAPS